MARKPLVARLLSLLLVLTVGPVMAARAETASLPDLLAAQRIQPFDPPTPAPDFTLPWVDGGEGALSAHHGDWVVLTFFATWCGPCRSEMPTLESLHRRYLDRGLSVLAVSVDKSWDPVGPYLAEHDLTLPVFWDERGEAGHAYRAASIPVSYLIDPTGRIVGMSRGARDWTSTQELFDTLLAAGADSAEGPSHYAALEGIQFPAVLEPPTAEWSLSGERLRPGRPFTLEVRLRWSGRIEDYLPQPPQVPLPAGLSRGPVAASSSSLDQSHLVRYRIELTADAAGVYSLDPIELRYLPALGDGPVAERVAGPTIEVTAAGLAVRSPVALGALVGALVLSGLWLHRRRRPATPRPDQDLSAERLRDELAEAKAQRLAGDAAGGYERLVQVARRLESAEERRDLEERLESVRFGGKRPDGAELESIERRLERALGRLEPDPEQESRRRLRLRREPAAPPSSISKEISR